MKSRLFLICAAVLSLSASAGARQTDLGRVPARTATLLSFSRHKEFDKSVYDFQHGVRGDKKSKPPVNPRAVSLNGLPDNTGLMRRDLSGGAPENVQETGNPFTPSSSLAPGRPPDNLSTPARRFDIRYGGLTWNGTSDWIEIVNRRDTRSVIKDLGALSWSEVASVPVLPPSPEPHGNGIQLRNRAIVSPLNVFVRAVPGHMYVLRIKDAKADYHVMFRVESLGPNGECTLTWKRAPSPKS